MTTLAPYGSWTSSLTPTAMATHGRRYGYPGFDARGAPSWCEQRPDEGGRVAVCRRRADGAVEDLTPTNFNARSRVHEYGGRPYVFDGEALWCAGFEDQRLARIEDGVVTLRSAGEGWRFAEPVVDARRDRIVAVAERHAPDERYPQNGVASVDRATGEVRWLVAGHDFVMSPSLSPDGARLAYIAWEHPHMSWDAAALYVAELDADGAVKTPARIAGGLDGSVSELVWRSDGALVFTLETDDRWQPHVWDGAHVRRVADVAGECGAPMWNVGTRTIGLRASGALVCVANLGGMSVVQEIDLDDGAVRAVSSAIAHVGALAVEGDEALCVVGPNMMGPAVVQMRADGAFSLLAGVIPEGPRPQALRFSVGDGAFAHGFLHGPYSATFAAPAGELPPLLVTAHGGPTGCASPLPSPAILFWTSRGFAVLDVNYRGSSGFGRAYRQSLRGLWGERDVSDCVAGARHLVDAGRVRRDALFIRGASAGGYTVLQALCDHDVFRGGACFYGVSDPRTLTAETHKLESRYAAFLFGEGDDFERAMATRTPLDHLERIRAPVIFFQGTEDLAVLPSQTVKIHAALEARGLASECHLYDGEQHGFRRAETIRDVLTREAAFYLRQLGAPAVP